MSRIGKKPISIPKDVTITITDGLIKVKGPKGELKKEIHKAVKIEEGVSESGEREIKITVKSPEDKNERALWGLFRALVQNMVVGVVEGYQKQLEINGVGYRVSAQGKKLVLEVGFSHPVNFELPEGIEAKVEKNVITISGAGKDEVGQVAANIRKIRKPEPYKGKGIKYVGEQIRRKAGKAA